MTALALNAIRHLSEVELACASPVMALLVERASEGVSHRASQGSEAPRGPGPLVGVFGVAFLGRRRAF